MPHDGDTTPTAPRVHANGHAHRGYEGFAGVVDELASRSTPAWPAPVRARQGAPNVVVMLMDDMGFSDIAPFGGEIATPALAGLAERGYRFTNYQTPPVCSPARAALLTSINPHRAGFASVAHSDPGFPGATLELADDVPTLAESFRAAGYATYMVGKWHLTKEANQHDAADRSSWPLQRGFDQYYGCLDGCTSLHHPHRLVRDNQALVIDEYPEGYYLTDDLTDNAIDMIKGLRGNDPDKPFLLYFAHQAVHGPLQAKPADIAKYRGRYDLGWDRVRDERFRRQLADGLFPEGTVNAPRNTEPGAEVPAWDELSEEDRELFARYMEVYAAAVDNVDQNLARLLGVLEDLGELDNTIIVFTSDNGATGEGGPVGTSSYFGHFAQSAQLPDWWQQHQPRDPELIGGPQTTVHYPRGWAYASNTPFRLYKFFAHAGGIRVPMIVSWPAGMPRQEGDPGVRDQFTYVTDIGETVLELAGVSPLQQRHGRPAPERDGASFVPVLQDAEEDTRHVAQYTEYQGRRAFVRDGWKVVSALLGSSPDWADGRWQLYDVASDPTETRDLAESLPELTRQLAEQWTRTAWYNTVFPINDDGSLSRQRPSTEELLERPVELLAFTPTLERFRSSKLTKFRSFDIEIDATVRPGDSGVLVSHGDQGGGYVLFVRDDEICFSYNEYGTMHRVALPLDPAGVEEVRLRFEALPGVCWSVTLSAGGRSVEVPVVRQLCGLAPFTGISVGVDRGGPVDWELHRVHGAFRYQGGLRAVRYLPGAKADYDPEVLIDIERVAQLVHE